jgi:hypothetical protein
VGEIWHVGGRDYDSKKYAALLDILLTLEFYKGEEGKMTTRRRVIIKFMQFEVLGIEDVGRRGGGRYVLNNSSLHLENYLYIYLFHLKRQL